MFDVSLSSGGFLTFSPSIPKSLLLDGAHNIESHFSLVNYQVRFLSHFSLDLSFHTDPINNDNLMINDGLLFHLFNFQIKQVRTALAVASLLNRTLVSETAQCILLLIFIQFDIIYVKLICLLETYKVEIMARRYTNLIYVELQTTCHSGVQFHNFSFQTSLDYELLELAKH